MEACLLLRPFFCTLWLLMVKCFIIMSRMKRDFKQRRLLEVKAMDG